LLPACEIFYGGWEKELENILIDRTEDQITLERRLCYEITKVLQTLINLKRLVTLAMIYL